MAEQREVRGPENHTLPQTIALVLENWNMLMIENGKFTISLLYWIAKEELDEHQQTLRRMSGGRWNI